VDRAAYQVGDPIQVCYRVPAPGHVVITDILADGTAQTFFGGEDDGTGGCIPGIVTLPAGTECMRLDYQTSAGSGTAQACFQVNAQPAPPSNWTVVGSAPVTNGDWNLDTRIALDPNATVVRVTSGSCDASSASVLVYEATLQREAQANGFGTVAFSGNLNAVGLAVSSGGSGHARIVRPVTLNPLTQVDLTLNAVGIVYNGTTLTACFRQP
jgi:hypothetical protein